MGKAHEHLPARQRLAIIVGVVIAWAAIYAVYEWLVLAYD